MDVPEIKAAIEEAEAELSAVYRKLRPLREAYAEAVPTATLPVARSRTPTQDKVARCPRCGGNLERENLQEQLEALREAATALYELVEMDESVGIGLSSRVESMRLGWVLSNPAKELS